MNFAERRAKRCEKDLLPNKRSKQSEVKIIKHFEPNTQFSNPSSSDKELPYFDISTDDEDVQCIPQFRYKERRPKNSLTNIRGKPSNEQSGKSPKETTLGATKCDNFKPNDCKRIRQVTISCKYKMKNVIKETKSTQTSTSTLKVQKTQSAIAHDSYLEDLKREIICNENYMRKTVSDLKNEIWLFQSTRNFEQCVQREPSGGYDDYHSECESKTVQLDGTEREVTDVNGSALVLRDAPNSPKIKSAQEVNLTRTKGLALTKEDYFTILNDQNTQIEKCLHLVTKAESLMKHIPNDLRICSSCHSPHSKDNFKQVIGVFNMSTQIEIDDPQENSPNKPNTSDKSNTQENEPQSSKQCDQPATIDNTIFSVPSGESWSEQGDDQKCEFAICQEVASKLEKLANENIETQPDDYTKLEEENVNSTSEEKIPSIHTKLSAHLLPSVVIRKELVTQKIPDVVIEPEESDAQIDNNQNVGYEILSAKNDKSVDKIDQVLKEHESESTQIVERTYVDESSQTSASNVHVSEDTVVAKSANTHKDEISKKIMGDILKDPDALSMYKSYQVIEENRVLPTCSEEIDEDRLCFIDKDVYKTYVNPSGFKHIKSTTSSSSKGSEVHSSLGNFYQNKATQVDGIFYENGGQMDVSLFKQAGKSENSERKVRDKDGSISGATVDVILSINTSALREMSQRGITGDNSQDSGLKKLESSETSNVKEVPQCDVLNKPTISDEFLLIHDGKMTASSSKTESFKRRSSTGSSSTANTDDSLKIFSLLETPSNSVVEASDYCRCLKFCCPKLKKEKPYFVKHEPESRPRKSSISEPKTKRLTEAQNNEGKDDGSCPSDPQQRRKVKIEEPLFGSHRLPLQECDPHMESFIKELTIGTMPTRASVPATIDPISPSRLHNDYSNEHVLSVIKKASEGLDDTKKKHTVMPMSIQQPTFIIDNCNCEQIKQYLKYTVVKYNDFKKLNGNVEVRREIMSEDGKTLPSLEEETHSEGEVTRSYERSVGEIRSSSASERVFVKEIEKSRRRIINRKEHNSNWVTYYVTSDDSTSLISS
uniref:Uncharacterized protein n=1 Tax=Photinus pyralis TaxID=7054 RepID=A0A1Y1LEW6_PHOPY